MRAQMITVHAEAMERFSAEIADTLEIVSEARIPLEDGVTARFCVFRDAVGSSPVAIILGEPDFSQPVAVRVHSACLTGDVFGSRRCDCGAQLKLAIAQLSETGGGVVLYLEQEGRGLGLANKMRAYELQDGGLDTMDANMMLGFDDDERDYGVAARMLRMISVKRVLLLTNNPGKLEALSVGGVEVTARVPLHTAINPENRRYLATKAARAGHNWRRHAGGRRADRNAIGTPVMGEDAGRPSVPKGLRLHACGLRAPLRMLAMTAKCAIGRNARRLAYADIREARAASFAVLPHGGSVDLAVRGCGGQFRDRLGRAGSSSSTTAPEPGFPSAARRW